MDTEIFETTESEVRSYSRSWPTVFVKASGSHQIAEDGTDYLDFFAGAGALNYGHNHPKLIDAIREYLDNGGPLHSLDMMTPARRDFLETFKKVILEPRGLDYKVMFPGPTGTNTVEAALKLARKVTGRQHILSFTNAFHGMTLGSLSVTGNSMKRKGAGIPLTNSSKIPYDDYFNGETEDFIWLERVLEDSGSGVDKPAAIIVETVQGEGGLRAARAEWLRQLAKLCKSHEILLIVDDVQAGCGRTGSFFSFEEAGITPDIVCVSKSISGSGQPLALTLFKSELDVWGPGEHNGTFRGNALALVTGAATLREFWADDTFEKGHLAQAIELVQDKLIKITAAVSGSAVRGRGLLTGIYFEDQDLAGKVAAEAFKRGMLLETSGPEDEVLKVMPPLTTELDELERGMNLIAEILGELTGADVSSITGGQNEDNLANA
ncbi:diaminobutyrate--2-oxoglutarate transaminase [Auritidibacter ignavus]|uniref:diaminobutyrate--2-oxoglutarate transaminase n=1 Tax=Auritidibacter ignavus TaxID=678932 RepID=UPI002449AD12|nr:diaminobutyrate--2-oxoglutarate transaminase [Auritidibacter ignavus]WGH81310.1 diaminobutyrate--2-oxoglutarate transaminase [Auritidibacter ignavus]